MIGNVTSFGIGVVTWVKERKHLIPKVTLHLLCWLCWFLAGMVVWAEIVRSVR